MRNKPTRFYSKKQENKVAKEVNGKRTANSGATAFQKGDVTSDDFLIECKTTTASRASFSIKKEWIEKNEEEAFAMGKSHSVLAFSFGENEPNYYVLNEKNFKEYLKLLKESV